MESIKQKCKKLAYKRSANDDSPTILVGLVVKEDKNFLYFKTARKEYRINQSLILSMEDTDIEFRGGIR